jgi:hypothetical protein
MIHPLPPGRTGKGRKEQRWRREHGSWPSVLQAPLCPSATSRTVDPPWAAWARRGRRQGCHCGSRHHRVPLLRMPLLRRDLGFSNEGGTPEQKGGETCSSVVVSRVRRTPRRCPPPSVSPRLACVPLRLCDNPPRKIPYYRLRPIHFGR